MGLVALTQGGTEPPFVGNPNLGSNQNQPLAYAFETQNLLLVDGIERGTQIGRLCMLLNGNIWIVEDSFEWGTTINPGLHAVERRTIVFIGKKTKSGF